jgi:hypothetical protein
MNRRLAGRVVGLLCFGLALLAPSRAGAHEDPPGCSETGASINVGIFRDSLATIPLSGSVSPCETIYYRAVLSKVAPQNPGDTVCAFSGGQFDFRTPNGVVTVISPNVPCVGATVGSVPESCVAGLNALVSPVIAYTVSPADIVGNQIAALSTYGVFMGITGVAHDGTPNTPGVVQASPKQTTVLSCDDQNACTTDVCDMPQNHGAAGCSHNVIGCDDGNACTADGCDQASGCFHIDITSLCDDNSACTTDDCSPATGCTHTPVVCDDGNACTLDGCDPSTGCTHSAVVCDDGNACTLDACDSSAGCTHTDITGTCDDGNACTNDGCAPATGCTHAPVDCNDGDACTADGCDPQSGCTHTDSSAQCDDGNACTADSCVPATGCVHTDTSSSCNDGDPCTDDSCLPQIGCVHAPSTGTQCTDHFQCYEVKPAQFTQVNVTQVDRFGSQPETVRYPHRLCAPANKNGEGIHDPVQHLVGYETVRTPFTKVKGMVIVNQFGSTTIDLTRRDILMVPSSKSVTQTPPPPLVPPLIDHFQCYRAKRTAGTARFPKTPVTVGDQFENISESLLKPYRLCVPTNKNNEDPSAPTHQVLQLCYKAKSATKFGTVGVKVNNQFGDDDDITLIHRRELCVPSVAPTP